MRDHKDSDSPSGYDREVQPRRSLHAHASGLHGEAAGMDPRGPYGVTLATIQHDQARKLTQLNDRNLRLGGGALSLEDPRTIAAQIAAQAELLRVSVALRNTDATDPATRADELGAQLLAFRLALARAYGHDITSGDAA